MKLIKSIYLTDRLFYVLGGIVICFFMSFVIAPFFYVAIALLGITCLLLLSDFFLLYTKKRIVKVRRTVPGILSLSDGNKIFIHLKNRSTLQLKIKIIDELPYQLGERDFNIHIAIPKEAKETISYELRPLKRGEYTFGDTHVMASSTIFFIRKKETTKGNIKTAVYPSIIQMKQQELIALHHSSFTQGDNKLRKMGKSYEFDQIKTYVPGDDPRTINWKATSRFNELMTNHFEDERSQQIYSIIDKSRIMKMPFDGLTLIDYAINTTLALSNIILKKQDNAGLITFSNTVNTLLKADKSSKQLKKIMYALHKEEYNYAEANYEALYANIRRKIPNRSLLFLYTNFDSFYGLERVLPILRMLNKYHLLIVLFFENTELAEYAQQKTDTVLDIYQQTIAQKFILEKSQIIKELSKHGIRAIKCNPKELSANTINKYLELKSIGII